MTGRLPPKPPSAGSPLPPGGNLPPGPARPEPRPGTLPAFGLNLALTTRAARALLALAGATEAQASRLTDADAREQATAALVQLLPPRQGFTVYLRNGGRGEGEEQVVEVRLASDAQAPANTELIERLGGKTLLLVGTEKEDRYSDETQFVVFNARAIPEVWGHQDAHSLAAQVSFGEGAAGLPVRVVAAVARLPEARAQREGRSRRLADWHRYLGVLERTARSRQFVLRYKSFRRGPGVRATFALDAAAAPVPWERLRAMLDEPLEVREPRGLAATAEGAANADADEGDWLLGTIVEALPERNELVLALDDEVERLLDHKTLEIPRSAGLVYKASGDLAQIRRLRFGLEQLEQGYSANARLGEFLFDARQARRPNTGRQGLPPGDLLQPSLNPGQLAAVEGALNAPDLFLIQGPPGTGKTTVIAEICYQNALRGQRTLIASQANLAVDHALSRLVHHPRIRALRRGRADRVEVEGAPFLEDQVVATWLAQTAGGAERSLAARQERLRALEDLAAGRPRLEALAQAMRARASQRPPLAQAVAQLEARIPELKHQAEHTARALARRSAALASLARLEASLAEPPAPGAPDPKLSAGPELLNWFDHAAVRDLADHTAELNSALLSWGGPAEPEVEPEARVSFEDTLLLARAARQRAAGLDERLAQTRQALDALQAAGMHWYLAREERAALSAEQKELTLTAGGLRARREALRATRSELRGMLADLSAFDPALAPVEAALAAWVNRLAGEPAVGPAAPRLQPASPDRGPTGALPSEGSPEARPAQAEPPAAEPPGATIDAGGLRVLPATQPGEESPLELPSMGEGQSPRVNHNGHTGAAPETAVPANPEPAAPLPRPEPQPATPGVFETPLGQEIWAAAAHAARLHRLGQLAQQLHTSRAAAARLGDLARRMAAALDTLAPQLAPIKRGFAGAPGAGAPAPSLVLRRRARRGQEQGPQPSPSAWRSSPLGALVALDASGEPWPASQAEAAWQALQPALASLEARPPRLTGWLGAEARRQAQLRQWVSWLRQASDALARRAAELESLARHRLQRLHAGYTAAAAALPVAIAAAAQHLGPELARRLETANQALDEVERTLPVFDNRLAEIAARTEEVEAGLAASQARLAAGAGEVGQARALRHFRHLLRQLEAMSMENWEAVWHAATGGFEAARAELGAATAQADPGRALSAIAADIQHDVARLEKVSEQVRANRRTAEQDLEAARRRLLGYDDGFAQELAWWQAAHAALPASLRPAAEPAAEPDTPEYVEAVLAQSAGWAAALEAEQAYVAAAERLVTGWAQHLREANPQDHADLQQIYIDNANVIGITCSQAGAYQFSREYRNFDCVIVDEVSKATPPELLLPMLKGARVVLVGDHRQLPPMIGPETVAELAAELSVPAVELEHLERSLFQELFEAAPPELRVLLTEQYRMHPQIMAAINQFYADQLVCGLPNPDERRAHGFDLAWLKPEQHILWLNTPTEGAFAEVPQGTTFANPGEVDVIARLLRELDTAWQPRVAGGEAPKEVGVITFYAGQVRELKERLLNRPAGQGYRHLRLRVGTVDRFQGMERPVIIVSLVRNNAAGNVGFARRPERVNVAFSRAQELLVIVGARDLFAERARDGQATAIYSRVAQVVQRAGGLRRTGDVSNPSKS